MEDRLRLAGLPSPVHVSDFSSCERLHFHYIEMEATPGWKDFRARILMMHDTLVKEILNGTLDKFGNAHEDSKRAALLVCDRILLLTDVLHRQYHELEQKKQELETRAAQHTGVHAKDDLSFLLRDV